MRFQRYIKLEEIKIAENRQRRHFDPEALNELREGIEKFGLFHAVVLRDGHWLCSGERRLRAISDIYELGGVIRYDGSEVPRGEIPWTDLGDLDPLAREEAELSENIHRSDLSWQERAQATSRLLDIRGTQASLTGSPAPTVADIAVEVKGSSRGGYQDSIRKEVIVAKHLADPEVAAAKTVDEAFKLLRRKEETQRNVALAAQVGRTYTSEVHKAFQQDALIWLAECDNDLFDVILTDPPYGIGADEFGDSGGTGGIKGEHAYVDDEIGHTRILSAASEHFFRITKTQAHLYVFCDIDRFSLWRAQMQEAGWWVFRTPLIFHKPNAPRAPWPECGPQRQYECILYAVKGKRPVTRLFSDVLIHRPDPQMNHSAQKPVALYEDLLRRSVKPGDAVLDCFSGTGTIFPAAHRLKCKATGVEKDPASYALGLKRLELLKTQPELEGLI